MGATRRRRAFIVRLNPGSPPQDALPEAIRTNELILGWSEAQGLLNLKLTWETFRQIVKETYELDTRQAGMQAQSLWIFLKEMKKGDLVVVPYGEQIYLAEVQGNAFYVPQKVAEDRAYRRPVRWLKNYEPVQRTSSAKLRKALRAQQTCTSCDALLADVEELARDP
jgi:predicted Mrr-cat superfamily restriction endonuclease